MEKTSMNYDVESTGISGDADVLITLDGTGVAGVDATAAPGLGEVAGVDAAAAPGLGEVAGVDAAAAPRVGEVAGASASERIARDRMGRVLQLMRTERLDAILVSNCSLGNLDTWLLAKEDMPMHLPFNRNNLCFIDGAGRVTELCARDPHPCDRGKHPLITETDLSDVLLRKKADAGESPVAGNIASVGPDASAQGVFSSSAQGVFSSSAQGVFSSSAQRGASSPCSGVISCSGATSRSRLGLVNPIYLKKVVRDDLLTKYHVEFVDISDAFHRLKAEKTPDEIAGVTHAASMFERAFTAIPMILTGEHTEREVAAAIRNRFREMDAECEDLQTSCMLRMTSAPDGGASVAEPIEWPGRRIVYGDRINISANGFMKGGFASALARTFVIGEPTAETVRRWNLAVEAQHLIAAHAVPGATIRELMELFRTQILEPAGLSAAPISSCNIIYGIGAAVFEPPRNIDTSCEMPLADGMTLVIAPQICVPGQDPYQIADVFVVRKGGAERLGTSSQELYILD